MKTLGTLHRTGPIVLAIGVFGCGAGDPDSAVGRLCETAADCGDGMVCEGTGESASDDSHVCYIACEQPTLEADCPEGQFCVGCRDVARLGPFLTCAPLGEPGRYDGVDLQPHYAPCSPDDPCPTPYECVRAPGLDVPPNTYCMLPCRGRDCPEGFYCSGIDKSRSEDVCGYCAEEVPTPPGERVDAGPARYPR